MDRSISKHIDCSQYFSQLVDEAGNINDTISTFLYYMFPRDLFIRALSLLESNDMIIYVLTLDQDKNVFQSSICATFPDTRSVTPTPARTRTQSLTSSGNSGDDDNDVSTTRKSSSVPPSKDAASVNNDNDTAELQDLLYKLYYDSEQLLCRFIVRSQDGSTSNEANERPILVDLENWMCSCDEFSTEFQREVVAHRDPEGEDSHTPPKRLRDIFISENDDIQELSDDRFAQLNAHSLSKQRYFRHDRVMCPHLLAFSIILRSSSYAILKHFVLERSSVFLIQVNSIDEWLKLHINIVQ